MRLGSMVLLSALAVTLMAPLPAMAAEGGLVSVNVQELVFTLVTFLVVLVILSFTAWKPILAGLKSRETAIREGIEAAAKARADAARTAAELEAKIADAQRAAAQEVARAKADAQKLAEGIRQQAETESAALKDRTLRDIQAAKQQAIAEINAHAAELGTAIARKILQREVQPGDQERLVQDSLQQLATSRI